ncbi:MAG: dihydropteroate synthase [Prevotellaceae bacterium]|nr:dihydropteroate synthase [Prevotellaceae bacterium]
MTNHQPEQTLLQQMGIDTDSSPTVMGILNCTPDSFFEGSRKQTESDIAERAEQILTEGGRIIDVGAFSTRPGADEVSEEEEMRRMRNALSIIRRQHPDTIVSVDTYRPTVARMAVEEYGANIVNDVSEGGRTGITGKPLEGYADGIPEIFKEVARLRVPYILMSVQADMDSMLRTFKEEVSILNALGLHDIILDPGYGFGKSVIEGNYAVLRRQGELRKAFPTLPVLAGISRKRMIWQLLGGTAQDATAMQGTMLANLIALQNGAGILRVHDVREAQHTITLLKHAQQA